MDDTDNTTFIAKRSAPGTRQAPTYVYRPAPSSPTRPAPSLPCPAPPIGHTRNTPSSRPAPPSGPRPRPVPAAPKRSAAEERRLAAWWKQGHILYLDEVLELLPKMDALREDLASTTSKLLTGVEGSPPFADTYRRFIEAGGLTATDFVSFLDATKARNGSAVRYANAGIYAWWRASKSDRAESDGAAARLPGPGFFWPAGRPLNPEIFRGDCLDPRAGWNAIRPRSCRVRLLESALSADQVSSYTSLNRYVFRNK
jgi:hypothetical protein